CLQYRSYPYNF
nr:immunoglobulin light chain junction region [Macaca mulatta]MOV79449.1 immunoglobulin light chain junction region [Macaca mulatta]MOV80455.1 immunoglobulin light chain junction region [Macaca mulatta]MOV80861.1 immunoglobulin light chain junction region [Macaca mulatta]MOV81057.1 immunoglobulin light chain junction region [Macaca mulatta]